MITIVVLLILAEVSINAIFSENGIINRAKDTQNKMNEAEEKEKISICVMGARLGDKGYQELTVENLQSSISSAFKDKVTNVISNGDDSFTVTIKDTEERKYTVDSDGTISLGEYDKWDGKSSTEPTEKTTNEIHIYTTSELKWLADQVNNEGNTFEGYTIYLENNLDLGAREKDGNWETTENEEVKWTAIGKEKAKTLQATFEGNNHIIKGVYVNDSTNFNGIFGNTNSILNLTVKNSYIKGATCTGGIVAALRSGTMENCHNVNTQVILIEGEYYTCGGVVGQVTGNIKNCSNTGTVTAKGEVGGISGYLGAQKYAATETKCYNKGEIKCTEGTICGEIIGKMAYDSTVTKCFYLNKNKSIFGVGTINEGGDLEEQRKGAQPTNVDLKSYDEFIKWIENQQYYMPKIKIKKMLFVIFDK